MSTAPQDLAAAVAKTSAHGKLNDKSLRRFATDLKLAEQEIREALKAEDVAERRDVSGRALSRLRTALATLGEA